ncbi:hypothetical protein ACJMK2_009652 [Sinanodonta woodiana]|uniref:Chlorophyllase n=1 Tax=Sinanodonta woodiana TaxID=1069815 RepID=A0ABD3VCW5_SINWO
MACGIFTVVVYFVLLHHIELIFVDNGNPYENGPLPVGELTLTETEDKSPLHTKLYFPLPKNEFPVIFFVGGFDGVVLAEFYEITLRKIASHGFYVFGVDYKFPAVSDVPQLPDLKPFYDELNFIHQYMPNKTLGTPLWNKMSLLCHSSGCDITLRMIRENSTRYTSTVFLEPFSFDVQTPVTDTIPAMMYGTEYCEEGLATCCVKGKDYARFYDIWKCPRIKVEVASFGHCDILDPIPRQVCKTTHFCKISNETNVDNYRQFVQGAISSFLITELQGRPDAISYIADQTKVPLKLLIDTADLHC